MNNSILKTFKEHTPRRASAFWRKPANNRMNKVKLWIPVVALGVLAIILLAVACRGSSTEPPPATTQTHTYMNDQGDKINMQEMTNAWAAEAGYQKRYEITDAERAEIASVVMAEAGGEPYAGKVAVAQCILQACEDDDIRPIEAVKKYNYTTYRPEPSEEALEAVQDVFDFGHVASSEPIKYFYAPARVHSEWNESQDYVMTIEGHKFFKEAK